MKFTIPPPRSNCGYAVYWQPLICQVNRPFMLMLKLYESSEMKKMPEQFNLKYSYRGEFCGGFIKRSQIVTKLRGEWKIMKNRLK